MRDIIHDKSVDFFETQFQRQVRDKEYALNPFEMLALEYLVGSVLDLGSGLGNLSLEAGRRGHRVVAVDASPTAVARINRDAQREGLPLQAIEADIHKWTIDQSYDTIVAIGLLMFFQRDPALMLLRAIQEHVRLGGRAIVNVLIEGTTYMGMFDPASYYLFRRDELEEQFTGWIILSSRDETFPAPGQTRKEFSTVIAEKRICVLHALRNRDAFPATRCRPCALGSESLRASALILADEARLPSVGCGNRRIDGELGGAVSRK